jgi:O-antigen/teichoic acid export membrane protein
LRLLTQIALRLSGLVLLPLVSKTLGVTEYGIWSQLVITAALVVPVLDLRLGTACVRFLAGATRENLCRDFFPMLLIVLVFASVVCVVAGLYASRISVFLFGDAGQLVYVRLLAGLILVRTAFVFLRNFYRATSQIKRHSGVELIASSMSILLAVAAVLIWRTLIGAVVAFIVVEAISALIVAADVVRQIGVPHGLKVSGLSRYLRYSIPLIPNTLLLWAINSSDRYVIAHMLDLEQMAVYSASYSLCNLSILVMSPITFVLYPLLSRLWEQGHKEAVRSYVEQALKYYLLLALPSVAGLCIISSTALRILASTEFVTSRLLVLLIAAGFLLLGIYQITLFVLHLHERTGVLPVVFVIAAAANLGLNLVLVPRMGILGAAVSTIIAYLLQAIAVAGYAYRLLRFGMRATFIGKAVGASAVMALAIGWIPVESVLGLASAVVLGAIVYCLLMAAMREIGVKELRMGLALLKRRGESSHGGA